MLEAISSGFSASQAANAYITALGRGEKSRGASPAKPIEAATESSKLGGKSELTEEERREVEKLKQRDAEVRRHEAAHKAAAGKYAKGGPTFEYETGPDGKQYAVGGEVQIDTSEVSGDPQATIQKMQQIQRAANAPAEPSSQDRRVAAQAARAEAKARAELAEENRQGDGSNGGSESGGGAIEAAYAQTGKSEPAGRFIDIAA